MKKYKIILTNPNTGKIIYGQVEASSKSEARAKAQNLYGWWFRVGKALEVQT